MPKIEQAFCESIGGGGVENFRIYENRHNSRIITSPFLTSKILTGMLRLRRRATACAIETGCACMPRIPGLRSANSRGTSWISRKLIKPWSRGIDRATRLGRWSTSLPDPPCLWNSACSTTDPLPMRLAFPDSPRSPVLSKPGCSRT